ncbi:MAG: tetratricopeptide repeat protein, partial [candidate division WOR-3 bacterium]
WKLCYNLGMLFNRLNMGDSAEKYFKQIDIKDPQIYTQIGESFRYGGKYQKAIEYFQEALRMNPRNASGYMGLIITYLDLKDTTSAVKILQDWIKFNPEDTSARLLLKSLRNP